MKSDALYYIEAACGCHIGKVRTANEDNFYFDGKFLPVANSGTPEILTVRHPLSKPVCFGVFDGMGGEAYGEVASAIAAETLDEYCQEMMEGRVTFDIDSYTQSANARICAEIEKHDNRRMGTTFALLHIQGSNACAYNIGDSRVYLLRGNKLTQLSQDHTQARRLVDMGILTAAEARSHSEKHKLTQHLGIFPDEIIIEPFDAAPVPVVEGDTFLLCSDGLTDMLEDKEIETIMVRYPCPKDTVEELAKTALLNGGKDNITVIVVRINKGGLFE